MVRELQQQQWLDLTRTTVSEPKRRFLPKRRVRATLTALSTGTIAGCNQWQRRWEQQGSTVHNSTRAVVLERIGRPGHGTRLLSDKEEDHNRH